MEIFIFTVLIIAIVFAAFDIYWSLKSGRAFLKSATFSRDNSPILFWLNIAVDAGLLIWALVTGFRHFF